jgi:hypothetical protein
MLFLPTIISILEVLIVVVPALLIVAFVTVAERKTMASMQRRLGPNSVGWYGLLQAFADALKLLLKEYVSPTQANLILFFLGPIITLIFSLLGYAIVPYGPGLTILDYNLGILYILAVSSLSTYGILLAGYGIYNGSLRLSYCINLNTSFNNLYRLVFWCIVFFCLLLFLYPLFSLFSLQFKESFLSCNVGKTEMNIECLLGVFTSYNVKSNITVVKLQTRKVQTTVSLNSIKPTGSYASNTIKSLHSSFIKELYKDRKAPVIPFNRESILATCENILDKKIRSEFLNKWGSKSCIYYIEYKHDPLIYYIGRTTLFKRRLNNHLKADAGNKFHLFLNLVGWEHFNVSIVEVCSLDVQGERENYYLQKYLSLLNSVFSSSITESSINITLKDKLYALKASESTPSSKNIPIYVYNIDDKGIDRSYELFNSIMKASLALGINIASISYYRNTSIPYKGKLFYTDPIVDFNQVFEASKINTPSGLANEVIAVKVWSYDAKNLDFIKGSPFDSKTKASKALGISRPVIDYFLDTGKPEGVRGTYLYTRPLTDREIKNLILVSENLQLGNKVKVWVYNAKTFELINNSPFPSLLDTANYFNVNYRTITRHLDTKLATMQNKTLVYFFKNEVSSELIDELKKDKPAMASYVRSEIWVYKLDLSGELTLMPDQPFLTKREAIKEIGIHISVLKKYLDTSLDYKGMFFFTSPRHK